MPSEHERIFKFRDPPRDWLSPEARALFESRMEAAAAVVQQCGWQIAKRAHALFLFSVVKDGNRAVSYESLAYALMEAGLIAETPPITVTSSPRNPVRIAEEEKLSDNEGAHDVSNISDDFDLGTWQ